MIPDKKVANNNDLPLSTMLIEHRGTTLKIFYQKLEDGKYFMSGNIEGGENFIMPTIDVKKEVIESLEEFIDDYKCLIDNIYFDRYLRSQIED